MANVSTVLPTKGPFLSVVPEYSLSLVVAIPDAEVVPCQADPSVAKLANSVLRALQHYLPDRIEVTDENDTIILDEDDFSSSDDTDLELTAEHCVWIVVWFDTEAARDAARESLLAQRPLLAGTL